MADSFNIQMDVSQVTSNMEGFMDRLKAGLEVMGNTVGRNMQSYARANKPWTNRTYSARNGLESKVEWTSDTLLDISVFHTVDYGIWLELAHGEKYAILQEARDSQIQTFKNMIQALDL